jgi:hypothetical protein
MTGQSEAAYSLRQAAYDLRKLRAKFSSRNLVDPGATWFLRTRPAPSPHSACCATRSSALSSPACVFPARADPPRHGPRIDRDYEVLRIGMQTLFADLGLSRNMPMAA